MKMQVHEEERRKLRTLYIFKDAIRYIVLDHDSAYIGGKGDKIYLLNTHGETFHHIHSKNFMVTPDETKIYAHDSCMYTVREWDAVTGRLLRIIDTKFHRALNKKLTWWYPVELCVYDWNLFAHDLNTGAVTKLADSGRDYTVFIKDQHILLITVPSTLTVWPNIHDVSNFFEITHTARITTSIVYKGLVIFGDAHGSIRIWDMATKTMINEANVHTDHVTAFYVNLDILVSCANDNVVIIWNTDTWEPKHILFHPAHINNCFGCNDYLVTDADHIVRIWDFKLGELLASKSFLERSLEVKMANNKLIVAFDNQTVFMRFHLSRNSVFAFLKASGFLKKDGDYGVARRVLTT